MMGAIMSRDTAGRPLIMFSLKRIFLALTVACAATLGVAAQTTEQTSTATDRQSVNISVYNSNLGLVRETRKLSLPSGRIALRFADVTAQIKPETVHLDRKSVV